jgi:hypothetical protein
VPTAAVDLFWLPLGAGTGGRCVRLSGRAFERVSALTGRRDPRDLYHSALEVTFGPRRYVLEMAPAWGAAATDRGVVGEGPVGLRVLGRSRLFRYEVRRWRDGTIPDVDEAVGGPRRMSSDPEVAARILLLASAFPRATWGRDELAAGEMWNSNSLVSWLLARSGHDLDDVHPPPGGRAPGWTAGLVVAGRAAREVSA